VHETQESPFLRVPDSERLAKNDLAFAIRDQYPVSPGHTLVIPLRVVATWFEATLEEQRAIWNLVDEVKTRLDAELHPDGYNVGFNAGAAAGQTVMHLHVHVIPRFAGDMDDPRGGVRHVIPSRGNYLQQAEPLSTGGGRDPFRLHLLPLFEKATDIAIVAAFVQQSGIDLLRVPVRAALDRGATVRMLTGDYLDITQAAALEELLDWMQLDPATQSNRRFEARVVETARLAGSRSFHPKSWRFERSGEGSFGVAYVGSSNVSRSALEGGVEWNLRVDRDRDDRAWRRLIEAFDVSWTGARQLDAEWIRDYSARARRQSIPAPPGEVEAESLEPPPEPHEIQRDALEALARTRAEGHARGLVVLATGLGKTWLVAFDVARLAEERGALPRVLFVAHRREILAQAARTFRRMLRERWPALRVGWFAEGSSDLEADLVFASVAKLSRPEHLARLRAHAFDYVVVDEVHHATAASYRRILDALEPGFTVGLTATPDRTDESDVLAMFDDNVIYRADLGVGIQSGRLVPFAYFGLKDEVDYQSANIPWRNGRFDPEVLAKAVQTERRMETAWRAWQAQAGLRTLVFCCSVFHAEFTTRWLREHGVRVACVHSARGSDSRDDSLRQLEAGTIDAVCTVDVLNEGVDLPGVDRIVMLRPTESPVLFLQQLGRGLRTAPGKRQITVIDFVGNHAVFLNRVRRLVSLVSSEGRLQLDAFLKSGAPLELPAGCSVELELEAKEVLASLLPRGASEVERVYRELRDGTGERPAIGELYRLGYLPSALRANHGSWFSFVLAEGDLNQEDRRAFEAYRGWIEELETTAMTRSFKMVALEALLEADAMSEGLSLEQVASRSFAIVKRSPELWRDVEDKFDMSAGAGEPPAGWKAYWRQNPIAAWLGENRQAGRAWFRLEDDRLVFVPRLDRAIGEGLSRLTRELVDYRLAQYRRRHDSGAIASFDAKITWNRRDPILKLPAQLPRGETDVRLPDGRVWRFRFMKEFCNVARPVGSTINALPDLLRSWFGPSAGQPGTDFRVRFVRSPDGLWLERLAEVVPLRARGRIAAFPDLRAAAGAATGSAEAFEPSSVRLPVRAAGEDVFAVRAAGNSMDGGREPIRDGDWLVLRYARGVSLGALAGTVALLQLPADGAGSRYQLKRIAREDGGWLLRSDNPEVTDFEATAETVPIAKLAEIVRPEALAPAAGTVLAEADLPAAFGLEEMPRTGRVDGHLFVLVQEGGVFTAPDRLARSVDRIHPGETAFVLARATPDQPWRYCGVARWIGVENSWEVEALDYPTWRALGNGRTSSRRLPEEPLLRAGAIAQQLCRDQIGRGLVIENGSQRARLAGEAARGGVRIDGGDGGFGERTISLTDLAWTLVAKDDARASGGLLDEARVNRLRYLEGTPRESTRWIDTGWALALLKLAR
jgi:superfamily II DNA or RNA helicase/diadenosine tetraphosphate (Ap4A) HIT family hydrolase